MNDSYLFTIPEKGALSLQWAKDISKNLFIIFEKESEINSYITNNNLFQKDNEKKLNNTLLNVIQTYSSMIEKAATTADIYRSYLYLYNNMQQFLQMDSFDMNICFNLQRPQKIWNDLLRRNCDEYSDIKEESQIKALCPSAPSYIDKKLQDILGANYYTLLGFAMLTLFTKDNKIYQYFLTIYSDTIGKEVYEQIEKWTKIRITREQKIYSDDKKKLSLLFQDIQEEYEKWKNSNFEYAVFICKLLRELRLAVLSFYKNITVWNKEFDFCKKLSEIKLD